MKKRKTIVVAAVLALAVLYTGLLASCGKYATLADFINSDAFQEQLGDATVESMDITFEAENNNTVKINYDLHDAISDDLLETARESYKETLEDKETAASLKEAYTTIHRLFPSEDIHLHVVFKDANGTLIAEKTYGAADFE